jgi:hypothetical protein
VCKGEQAHGYSCAEDECSGRHIVKVTSAYTASSASLRLNFVPWCQGTTVYVVVSHQIVKVQLNICAGQLWGGGVSPSETSKAQLSCQHIHLVYRGELVLVQAPSRNKLRNKCKDFGTTGMPSSSWREVCE